MASTSKVSEVRNTDNINATDSHLRKTALETMKAEFNEKLRSNILSSEQGDFSIKKLWSSYFLNVLMSDIKKEEKKSMVNKKHINRYRDKFQIDTSKSDGKNQLLVNHEGKYKIFLAWQDIFDLLWKLHLEYNHPQPEILMNVLEDEYIIQDYAVQYLNEVCCICLGEDRPFARCAVNILPMELTPDSTFSFIMVYEELHTGFIHLTPLSTDTMISEVAVELLRLFMDYGPAKKIFTDHCILEQSLDQVKHLTKYAPFDVEIVKIKSNEDNLHRIQEMLSNWINKSESVNWAIGCYVLQWQLNNMLSGPHEKSPFDLIFRHLDNFKGVVIEERKEKNNSSELVSTSASLTKDVCIPSVSPINVEATQVIAPDTAGQSTSKLSSFGLQTLSQYTISDDEMDEPEVFMDIDDEILAAGEKDPLALD